MISERVDSQKAAQPVGLFPHARWAGPFLFLSGIGPRERGTTKIPGVELDESGKILSHDIVPQIHSVFRNVRLILEEAGCSWNQLVDVTVYLTHMEKDFKIFNQIWSEYFKESPPCRTTVEVNCLPTPIAIELKCIAVKV